MPSAADVDQSSPRTGSTRSFSANPGVSQGFSELSTSFIYRQPRKTDLGFFRTPLYKHIVKRLSLNQSESRQSQLKKSKSLIDRWCGGWRWVERVRLYEAYLDQQRQRALVKQVEEMLERHTQYARWLQTKAAAAIIEVKPAALTVEQARRYLETGIKVERDALGVVNGRPPSSANDGGQEQAPGGFLESYLAGLEEEELDLLIANLRLGLENNP